MSRILKYGEKAAVTKEEQDLPYFKYFERDMAPVPVEKLALLDKVQHRVVPFDKKICFLPEKMKQKVTARRDMAYVLTVPVLWPTGPICLV